MKDGDKYYNNNHSQLQCVFILVFSCCAPWETEVNENHGSNHPLTNNSTRDKRESRLLLHNSKAKTLKELRTNRR